MDDDMNDSDRFRNLVRLDLSKHPLYGFDTEKSCIRKAVENENGAILLISGKSGVGKSATLLDAVKTVSGATLITGKFKASSRPLEAVSDAICELIDHLQMCEKKDAIRNHLRESLLGEEAMMLLVDAIPSLGLFLHIEDSTEIPQRAVHTEFGFQQFVSLLRDLVKCVCQVYDAKIVMLFDDLQWSDKESLAIFKTLAAEIHQFKLNLCLVGTYRNDEVSETLQSTLNDMSAFGTTTTQVHLGNLSGEDVCKLVSAVLSLDAAATMPLSNEVYRKTRGNAFFTLQFLGYLADNGYLTYSFKMYRWEWSLAKIKEETGVTENVVDILSKRMCKLQKDVGHVLVSAAYLGLVFDEDMLEQIVDETCPRIGQQLITGAPVAECSNKGADKTLSFDDSSSTDLSWRRDSLGRIKGQGGGNSSQVSRALHVLQQLGLVENIRSTLWKFPHDRIHESAYNLMGNEEEQQNIHLRIGRKLHHLSMQGDGWKNGDSDRMFFTMIEQFSNCDLASIGNADEKLSLCRLYLQAAQTAKLRSAFVKSHEFASEALLLLEGSCSGGDHWSLHYSLSMELHRLCADVALCSGDYVKCATAATEITRHAKTLKEQVTAFNIQIRSLGQQGRVQECIKYGRAPLNAYGVRFPRMFIFANLVWTLTKIRHMLRHWTDEQIESLSYMDERSEEVVGLLTESAFVISTGNKSEQIFSSLYYLKILEITLMKGLSRSGASAQAFAMWGNIANMAFKDRSEATRFGVLALRLAEREECARKILPRVQIVVLGLLHHLKFPIALTLEPQLKAYKLGMAEGNVQDAMLTISAYCVSYVYIGLPLGPLVEDMRKYVQLMREYNTDLCFNLYAPFVQLIEHLNNDSNNDAAVLTGTIMNEATFLQEAEKSGNLVPMVTHVLWMAQHELCYRVGEYDRAWELEKKLRRFKSDVVIVSQINYYREIFFRALLCLALASKHPRSRKYSRLAKKYMRKMLAYVQNGTPNCTEFLLILKAEEMTLVAGTSIDAIKSTFLRAIQASRRTGNLHNRAIAQELLGDALWLRDEEDTAREHLRAAYLSYMEWGAVLKCNDLLKKYEFLNSPHTLSSAPSEATGSGHLRGRERFSTNTISQFSTLHLQIVSC